MLSLLPARLKPLPRATSHFLWAEFASDTLVLWRIVSGERQDIARLDLASLDGHARRIAFHAAIRKHRELPVALVIPSGQVLRKKISLPYAARENLRQVVGFEMNRHTPFQSGQAYFDCRILSEDGRNNSLAVLLTVAPTVAVENPLQQLREWGKAAQALVAREEIKGHSDYANLLPPELRPGPKLAVRLLYAGMVLLASLLLATAIGLPIWQKREQVVMVNQQVVEQKEKAEAVLALREQLENLSAEYQYLLAKKYTYPTATQLLEEVSRLLPDDTWLSHLSLGSAGQLSMQGETDSSAGLIRLFERSGMLGEAAFTSPLVKAGGKAERFNLGVKVNGNAPGISGAGGTAGTPTEPTEKRQ